MPFMRTDLWRCAVVHAPMSDLVAAGSLAGRKITWLNETRSFRFLADPFGYWRDGMLHVFAEALDYRDKRGRIDCLRFDADFRFLGRQIVLSEPWHLSYPVVFEADGEIWMLPEAYRSGALRLYRAARFPDKWEVVPDWSFPVAAIDASPVWHGGLWWMFFSPPGSSVEKQSLLCAAYAESFSGPWRLHPRNPLRRDLMSARPGGTPLVTPQGIVLPTQDCTRTYGGAVSLLAIDELSPELFSASVTGHLIMPDAFAPWVDGLHTLSSAGPVTLIDAKRVSRSPTRLAFDARRWAAGRIGRVSR